MRDYCTKHGPIPVIDDFDRVRPLTSRDSMLAALGERGILVAASDSGGGVAGAVRVRDVICRAPPQTMIHAGEAI